MTSGVPKALRYLILERDSYTCAAPLCENAATDVHHLIPRSAGGKNRPWNLVALCRFHHAALHHEEYLPPEEREDLEQALFEYACDAHAEELEEDGSA
jgi:5-methylcytosine-specific restriction endonuclease McrA